MRYRHLSWLITVLAFLAMYLPLAVLTIGSFRDKGEGWTLRWYQLVLNNEQILSALGMSLWIAGGCTLIGVVIGTAAALAIRRSRFPGRKVLDAVTYLPLVMPEIVMGLSLLIWFVALNITLGAFSMTLAHVTFSVSYIVMTVKARLEDFDLSLEEAARDLGASPWKTFTRVTLPLIRPAVISGGLMAFTLSFDDFLISFFTTGIGTDTLPLKIYAMIKFGVSPEIHAVSTLLMAATVFLVLLFFRPFSRRESLQSR